jgi:hypothetical protein
LDQLVRHAVVANCQINSPTNVYFLDGSYVKYPSNDNFAIRKNQPGMDLDFFKLMNALNLVCIIAVLSVLFREKNSQSLVFDSLHLTTWI